MTEIVRIVFGSHLYGTQTDQSDRDFKAVALPSGPDVLMGRAPANRHQHRQKAHGERNTKDDVDDDVYSLGTFLHLLEEGQTGALDMLFAPEWAWVPTMRAGRIVRCSDLWMEIQANRGRLLTRRAEAFLGYCRGQANKYGIKGSRVAAARTMLWQLTEALGELGPRARVGDAAARLEPYAGSCEHVAVLDIPGATGLDGVRREVRHLEVCNRKMPYTQSLRDARELMQRLVAEYGKRALQAESNQGVDWKALSHAVRVGHESIELLQTGHITFPRPEAAHLLQIKAGGRDYRDVAAEIEDLLERVEAAAGASALPDSIDREWADGFIERAHLCQVKRHYGLIERDEIRWHDVP